DERAVGTKRGRLALNRQGAGAAQDDDYFLAGVAMDRGRRSGRDSLLPYFHRLRTAILAADGPMTQPGEGEFLNFVVIDYGHDVGTSDRIRSAKITLLMGLDQQAVGAPVQSLARGRFAMTIAASYPEPRKWRSNTHLSSRNI